MNLPVWHKGGTVYDSMGGIVASCSYGMAGERPEQFAHAIAHALNSQGKLIEACEGLLRHGLKGGDDMRLVYIACKGKELAKPELDHADQFDAAVKAARSAIQGAKG